jgi:ubiquinone/menaquinone biosynthesis C-methylase UbiE
MKISNYDENDYDYSVYWKNRNYEHNSEVTVLSKLLNHEQGSWFLDIGGSFGRHLPLYSKKYAHPVITDYSLNTLINNKFRILKNYPNANLVAANAYHLPFRSAVFDGTMMVRVLHHLEDSALAFNETKRCSSANSIHIQEVANKVHLKARLKHIFDLKFFDWTPYQQPTKHSFEGTNGTETVFLNFHPDYIRNQFSKLNFKLASKTSVSMFRLSILKKTFSPSVLNFSEKIFQSVFGWTYLAPSVFLKFKNLNTPDVSSFNKLEEILVCPKCKSELTFKNEECVCNSCKAKYEKVAGIWDFRIEG